MALERTYRLTCDGWSLIERARTLSDSSRRAVMMDCEMNGPVADSSAKASARAWSASWVRHREDLPGEHQVPFDLCPRCAGALIQS